MAHAHDVTFLDVQGNITGDSKIGRTCISKIKDHLKTPIQMILEADASDLGRIGPKLDKVFLRAAYSIFEKKDVTWEDRALDCAFSLERLGGMLSKVQNNLSFDDCNKIIETTVNTHKLLIESCEH